MKKILIISALLLLPMVAMAQKHLNFLGEPLGCNINTFKERMIKRGFKYEGEKEKNIYYFDGVFGGDDVTVGAVVTSKKIVYNVAVIYKIYRGKSYDDKTMDLIKFKKSQLDESLSKKYGINYSLNESFSQYETDEGFILINFTSPDEYNNRQLTLWYEDKLSSEENKSSNENDY